MEGWIKIDRAIMDHWIFQDAEYFRAWMLILMSANYEEGTVLINKVPTKIRRGEFCTSLNRLSTALGWNKRTTVRFLDLLEKEGMVTKKCTTNCTTLTLVNYDKYQGGRTTECTTDCTTECTTECTADCTEKKKEKKVKNIKNNARAREGRLEKGPVRKTSFHNFQERHTDYDALFGGTGK